jgi:hypothetical protein
MAGKAGKFFRHSRSGKVRAGKGVFPPFTVFPPWSRLLAAKARETTRAAVPVRCDRIFLPLATAHKILRKNRRGGLLPPYIGDFYWILSDFLESIPCLYPFHHSGQNSQATPMRKFKITLRAERSPARSGYRPSIASSLRIPNTRTGTERITDQDIESWKPAFEKKTVFA